ncbi:MAG: amidohydrolase family protein [Candidatus Binatia bacterium]
MQIVDLDSHSDPRTEDYVIEPEYDHLKPRMYFDAKGNRREVFAGKVIRNIPSDLLERANNRVHQEWRRARYDGAMRYEHVKEAGIDFQFVSAGIVSMFNYMDAKAGAAYCRSANNWLYKNFVKPYPETFSPLPQLPLQDIPEALKEIERCVKEFGARTFLSPSNWNKIDMADPYWWSFWDKVRELGITSIIIHRGGMISPFIGQERVKVLGGEATMGPRVINGPFEYTANIINLIFGGMMDAFPEFKFTFLEVGAEYYVPIKHRIQDAVEDIGYLREKITQPLEKYFERIYFVLDDTLLENSGRRLQYVVEELGADQLVFGSDYPHTDSHSLVHAITKIEGLGGVSKEVKEKILGGNALRFLGTDSLQ